jgi:type IV pilus assembly protein PilY1
MCKIKDQVDDNRCGLPIKEADLYDVTPNTIGDKDSTEEERIAAVAALKAAKGWRIDLKADGEKNLAKSVTIDGWTYFSTFSPVTQVANLCVPSPGTARMYALRLADGVPKWKYNPFKVIGDIIVDTPSTVFTEDGSMIELLPQGTSLCDDDKECSPGTFDTGANLPDPYGTYWYQEEY